MNEFNAQIGGRYVYVDDVLNLQDLALAFGHIFDECDNFIISGCEVSDSTIAPGYVYLNGKVRYFSGASNVTTWPQYLYEKNSTESVHYANGNTKIGRNIYGLSMASSVPTTADALTGKIPVSMPITQSGGTLMKDAFFGKYALVLNAANLSQVLNGSLKISGDLEVVGGFTSQQNHIKIADNKGSFDLSFVDGNLYSKTKYSSNSYAISMEDGVGIGMYANNALVAQVNENGIIISANLKAQQGAFTSASIGNIYNGTDATSEGRVNINLIGYNGATSYYRNTVIGNGRGSAVVSINGANQSVQIDGLTTIASGESGKGLVLKGAKSKTSVNIQKMITWEDVNASVMAQMGFTETLDASFRIYNSLSNVAIYGASNSYVDIGPVIKENGQSLADKYVQVSILDTLAKSADVFSKTDSDDRYSLVSDGFSGYINAGQSQETLRTQIDAVGNSDLNGYLKKSEYLADVATDEDAKKKIRDNIGALGSGDYQTKLKDSGWIALSNTGLYIRQIGNVVCVQGTLQTAYLGTIFTIPNTIDPPTYAVSQSFVSDGQTWLASIDGGSRACKTTYSSGSGNNKMQFSITYMV